MIENELKEIMNDIEQWSNLLNEKGIWLFLATLGCLGIPDTLSNLRITAFIIIFGMFIWYLFTSLSIQRVSFPKRFKALAKKITDEVANEVVKIQLLNELKIIKKNNSSFKNFLKSIPYLISVIFWWISFNTYFQDFLKKILM